MPMLAKPRYAPLSQSLGKIYIAAKRKWKVVTSQYRSLGTYTSLGNLSLLQLSTTLIRTTLLSPFLPCFVPIRTYPDPIFLCAQGFVVHCCPVHPLSNIQTLHPVTKHAGEFGDEDVLGTILSHRLGARGLEVWKAEVFNHPVTARTFLVVHAGTLFEA